MTALKRFRELCFYLMYIEFILVEAQTQFTFSVDVSDNSYEAQYISILSLNFIDRCGYGVLTFDRFLFYQLLYPCGAVDLPYVSRETCCSSSQVSSRNCIYTVFYTYLLNLFLGKWNVCLKDSQIE